MRPSGKPAKLNRAVEMSEPIRFPVDSQGASLLKENNEKILIVTADRRRFIRYK